MPTSASAEINESLNLRNLFPLNPASKVNMESQYNTVSAPKVFLTSNDCTMSPFNIFLSWSLAYIMKWNKISAVETHYWQRIKSLSVAKNDFLAV